ncbi:MAG: helicase-related protein, partial [bacterium]
PRYGLGNYLKQIRDGAVTDTEQRILDNLARAGKRLMGFCRVNLFKRLESSGFSFLLSLERHALRNTIFLHALKNKLDIPIGTQDQEFFGFEGNDQDDVSADEQGILLGDGEIGLPCHADAYDFERSDLYFQKRAKEIYARYLTKPNRFKWIRSDLFKKTLQTELARDASSIRTLLSELGAWKSAEDAKLAALKRLVTERHASEKVLVFTQFADTARYLERQLQAAGIAGVGCAYGDSEDPTELACRFSPDSNKVSVADPLRILVATDVLSEGQNLQDAHIIVNYDLPWAIIRLIQRAGRVDRIGQKATEIICYSFLPAEGVERIIKLRQRITSRLQQNAEVVGTDEIFFENEAKTDERLRNLYTEDAHVLDDDEDNEVDLCSLAFQIWQNAIVSDPSVEKKVTSLPPVIFATRPWTAAANPPGGALVYVRTNEGADALAWVDTQGRSVTESQYVILQTAQCLPDTPALPRQENHHELVKQGLELVSRSNRTIAGHLGSRHGARYKAYERIKGFVERNERDLFDTLFDIPVLRKAMTMIHQYPLTSSATDQLNRQIRSGVRDEDFARLIIQLYDLGKLCAVQEKTDESGAAIICSLGLAAGEP